MQTRKLVLFTILLLTSSASGQTLTLPASATVAVNSQLDITAVSDCEDIRWIAPENPGLVVMEYGRHGGKATDVTVIGLVPGSYRLRAIGAKAGKLSQIALTIITVPGAPPTPTPTPIPDGPTPTAKSLSIVTIDDTTARTAQTAAFLGDDVYWQSLVTTGNRFWKLDKTDPVTARYAALTAAGLPVIILMDAADSKVLYSGPLPVDKTALTALITKFRSPTP